LNGKQDAVYLTPRTGKKKGRVRKKRSRVSRHTEKREGASSGKKGKPGRKNWSPRRWEKRGVPLEGRKVLIVARW